MQIKLTGRHVSVTDNMKDHAREKAEKLLRFFDRIQEIRVVLDQEGGKPSVEYVVDIELGDDLVAHDTSEDMFGSIDAVADKLERQLRRHKERLKEHHKRGAEPEPPPEQDVAE